MGYAVPKEALQYLSSEEMGSLDVLTKPVKTDYNRFINMLQDPQFNKTHLAKAMQDNINDMPTQPQIKVADVAVKVTKFQI